jgi:flavin reductase (DIM6/NTAB) family NADH-FMN oxidoreductase RutF
MLHICENGRYGPDWSRDWLARKWEQAQEGATCFSIESMADSKIAPMLTVDPAHSAARDVYKLMTGIIVPRPVALVSTVDRNGVANVAPFSFFSGVGAVPPTLLFCPALRTDTGALPARKDSLRNVEETGEFVVNVVSEALAAAANATSAEVPPEVDEFALAGLTPLASEAVKPPRVAESPAQMECKLLQVIYTGRHAGSGVIVLGEIVRLHVRADLIDNFRVDPAGLDAVGRMAGNTWVRTRERIELVRPK